MTRHGDDLTDILENQIANYHDLKKLILEKRKAIVVNDLEKLSDITSQIELVIVSNNQLESERIDIVEKIAADLNLPDKKPALAQLASCFENPFSEKLMELRRRIIDAIKDVQHQNRTNSEMLKYCANLMDSVLRRMVNEEPYEPTYGSTGKTKKIRASSSLLDQHI